MKIIVEQIQVGINTTESEIFEIARARIKNMRAFSVTGEMYVYKRSVDARHKDSIKGVYSVCAEVECKASLPGEDELKRYGARYFSEQIPQFALKDGHRGGKVLVVGFGPAGMFCALALARAGVKPVVIERGGDIDSRVASVNRFYSEKILDTESNIQFGAGGAGTFSDGKLTTRINDPKCSFVLSVFAEHGAPEEIKYMAKPHIGTDKLRNVVKNIQNEIISLGGEIRYNTKLLSFSNGVAETTCGKEEYDDIVLAIGHSARDTYAYLMKSGFAIEPKPFSVGVRAEHLQSDINRAMYGESKVTEKLGAADYNVSYRKDGRGVYSFCMCPGGEVVAGASEEGGVVVNGMSSYARDGKNANSAIAVQINTQDYGDTAEGAIEFQRNLERKAFSFAGGNYKAPIQTLGDFYKGISKTEPSRVLPTYMDGNVSLCDMNKILPKTVCDYLKMGFRKFGEKIEGFDAPHVVLTGVETRTSSPVRIMRGDDFCAFGKRNIYPCGEGAGYAGGIMSAAVDGLNVATAILEKYNG